MDIRLVGAELFYADKQKERRTDKNDVVNSRFSQLRERT
jgi:hypothetical protein